jgi:RNA-directed DNA polymerase
VKFTALLHHIYRIDTLRFAYSQLKRQAAPGVDGETWRHYGEVLEENLQNLSHRLKREAYRAKTLPDIGTMATTWRHKTVSF